MVLDGSRLLYHELPAPRLEFTPNAPQGIPEIPVIRLARNSSRVGGNSVPELVLRLCDYFAGGPVSFEDVQLDLEWCTPFQRALVVAARSVPRGETVTYGELAALAGRPNAPRAAGSFCAHNRFGVVVPCHRVVASGGLGSYGSLGRAYKQRMLELEGADVAL
ncbi:MAG: methylated-DNA--[protein]-cysteine S-methyltransferase [Actinobacteria bacterium]|nr:methylated-DNA--[protein]-cysteine S-methyltransferase [Actinomycetota bacterium]